jgi:hypothetical protein
MKPKLTGRLIRMTLFVLILMIWLVPGLTTGATADSPTDLAAGRYSNLDVVESSNLTCPVDMIAYWKLDETAGSTFEDYFASNDGVCTDKCPDPAVGIVKGSQLFSGKQEINIPYHPAFDWDSNSNFSIEVWANIPEDEVCESTRTFISRYGGFDYEKPPAWWVGCDYGTGTAVFSMRDSVGVGEEISGGPALNDGKWHHVVAVRDGNKDENQLYVDGILVKSEPVDYLGDWKSNRGITIGYHNVSPYYYFNGKLDEIAIYGKALSQAEIQYHYNKGLEGKDYCDPVSLTININGSGSVEEFPSKPYTFGQEVTLTAIPEPGLIFYDWSGDLVGFDNPAIITMDGDKVVTATFSQPIWYTLAVETTGEGVVLVEPDLEEYLHGDKVTLTAVPEPGWRFTGWSGDLAGDDKPVDLVMTADKNVIATFSVPKIFLPLSLK